MTEASPNVPDVSSAGTPRRSIRVPDETWVPAVRIAAMRGETVSDVVRAALEEYIADEERRAPADGDEAGAD